jgi:hypothetical protein
MLNSADTFATRSYDQPASNKWGMRLPTSRILSTPFLLRTPFSSSHVVVPTLLHRSTSGVRYKNYIQRPDPCMTLLAIYSPRGSVHGGWRLSLPGASSTNTAPDGHIKGQQMPENSKYCVAVCPGQTEQNNFTASCGIFRLNVPPHRGD